jgi:hypothetical protein
MRTENQLPGTPTSHTLLCPHTFAVSPDGINWKGTLHYKLSFIKTYTLDMKNDFYV